MAEEKITMKQEIFCQEWIDSIGNGTIAALKAFDIEGKELVYKEKLTDDEVKIKNNAINIAAVMANEYLRKPNIIKRLDKILEERGFNDEAIRKEHFKLVKQDTDYSTKMRAISDYYKLKGSYEPDKVKHTVESLLTDEQKQRLAKEILNGQDNTTSNTGSEG